MKEPVFLLTNDDGSEAKGLKTLSKEMKDLARIVVVAPVDEQSGVGHGLTIRRPLRVFERGNERYALTGTPVDCIIFALRKLLPDLPDLVISGINHGANLGDDVHYSGTVAAAREAALYGIPAIAASLVSPNRFPDFKWSSRLVKELVKELGPDRIPRGTYLNVNIPEGKPQHYRFTRQGTRLTSTTIEAREDPEGGEYFWIDKEEREWVVEADTDYKAVREGTVSVTPMHRDHTDFRTLRGYANWTLSEDTSK